VLALKDDRVYPEAYSKVNLLINQFPGDTRSYQIKGEIAFALRKYQDALETYDQLLALTSIIENKELTASPIRIDCEHTLS
jgi:tetratricopeptide (TPR) repeat protein